MKKILVSVAIAVPTLVLGTLALWQLAGEEPRSEAALVATDPVPLSWRGGWASDARYAAGHVVVLDGSSFVAARANSGERPAAGCAECSWTALGVEGPPGPRGLAGPAGPSGAQGATGLQGPSGGVSGFEVITSTVHTVAAGESRVISTPCPAGKVALGGGIVGYGNPAATSIAADAGFTVSSVPGGNGWLVIVRNTSSETRYGVVRVACATMG